ncbi:hypothetical protein HXX76_001577 [Chlamydomonas incerta]|uniref:Uncharacterized protein n=1 Tax=Chlamydomonas incerta TaxID=51695 RepID=A0A835WCF9_CHLIN|nr:hypothetical protein HXX76_001577 [Chlamydomonas incerta]|eukprot:KAG2444836.1 hypothetical protein HXX76_001577 [Chlamydomonas incerta]
MAQAVPLKAIAAYQQTVTVTLSHIGVQDVDAPTDEEIASCEEALHRALALKVSGASDVTDEFIAALAKDRQIMTACTGSDRGVLDMIKELRELVEAKDTALRALIEAKFAEQEQRFDDKLSRALSIVR